MSMMVITMGDDDSVTMKEEAMVMAMATVVAVTVAVPLIWMMMTMTMPLAMAMAMAMTMTMTMAMAMAMAIVVGVRSYSSLLSLLRLLWLLFSPQIYRSSESPEALPIHCKPRCLRSAFCQTTATTHLICASHSMLFSCFLQQIIIDYNKKKK